MSENGTKVRISEEQILYAKILQVGMYAGLILLLVTFALYASGALDPGIPLRELPNYWQMNVREYLMATNTNHLHHEHTITGWAWISLVQKADYLNYVGITLLAAVTIVCYIGIIPTLIRKRDLPYALMALLEVTVLILAASGVLAAGH